MCDKIKGATDCMLGLTKEYALNEHVGVWFCYNCNWCICEKCLKADMLIKNLTECED